MKLKKLKRLMSLINDLCKHGIDSVKPRITNTVLPNGKKLVMIPVSGPEVKKETREILAMIKKIKPEEMMEAARKINFQTGMNVLEVFLDPSLSGNALVIVHTPLGGICINWNFPKETMEKFKEEQKPLNPEVM